MKKGKLTAEMLEESAWAAALAQITAPVDVVPPGWMTSQGLVDKLKLPNATLRQRLNRLLATGKAERKMFRVKLAKQTRPVMHYRLK
jgi:hypothetical protein